MNLMKHLPINRWLAIGALMGCALIAAPAMGQAEPTLNQVYEAARSGQLDKAQTMMQQVLVAHPNSAKAHFVQAELSAQQGELGRARESLATAEKLAPGLPFAKTEAVDKLRQQLATKASQANNLAGSNPSTNARTAVAMPAAPAAPASSFPWGLALAAGGGAIALVIFLSRKKQPAQFGAQPSPFGAQPGYGQPQGAGGGGLSGPQRFGAAGGLNNGQPQYGPGQPQYGQPQNGQSPYGQGQPVGSGMGGRVMGGLATGLAVGAGVMAAQAIGKSLMGNNDHPAQTGNNAAPNNGYEPFAGNNDLGGQNFGVADGGSWDDGGDAIASSGDGGDWDT
jgi:hypothetical protein